MGDFFSPSTTESTQKSEPWKPQQDFIKYGFDEAARIYQQPGPDYFPNSTVAGFSPQQSQAFQMGTDRATNGNQTMQAAEGYTQDVLGGKYLNSDPYADDVFKNVQQRIMPGINTQFSNSGRYGSGLHQGEAIDRMTTAYAPIASQQYQQGLNRMDGAAAMAPTYAANDYRDIGALDAIGGQVQGLGQRELDDQVRRWSYYQDLPANKLGQYAGLISGNYGGVQTAETPGASPFASLLGAGLAAAGTAGGLGWAPFAMSDKRAKKNARRVGHLDDGTPVYAYQYLGSEVTHIGVMAQEVEVTHPEAVMTRPDGLKMVNYGALADAVTQGV